MIYLNNNLYKIFMGEFNYIFNEKLNLNLLK